MIVKIDKNLFGQENEMLLSDIPGYQYDPFDENFITHHLPFRFFDLLLKPLHNFIGDAKEALKISLKENKKDTNLFINHLVGLIIRNIFLHYDPNILYFKRVYRMMIEDDNFIINFFHLSQHNISVVYKIKFDIFPTEDNPMTHTQKEEIKFKVLIEEALILPNMLLDLFHRKDQSVMNEWCDIIRKEFVPKSKIEDYSLENISEFVKQAERNSGLGNKGKLINKINIAIETLSRRGDKITKVNISKLLNNVKRQTFSDQLKKYNLNIKDGKLIFLD